MEMRTLADAEILGRPAERVQVSEAWPSLSKEINLTTRERIRAQDPVPEHIARRLVDSSDTVTLAAMSHATGIHI
jgi:hypothetical protein